MLQDLSIEDIGKMENGTDQEKNIIKKEATERDFLSMENDKDSSCFKIQEEFKHVNLGMMVSNL